MLYQRQRLATFSLYIIISTYILTCRLTVLDILLICIFLDLYEEENMSDRLIKMEKEWPGAVLQILKLGKLTPVSWSYVSN